MFSKELGDPGATEFDHPSRTYRGWAIQGTNPVPLKAHPLSGCAKEPFRGGKPPTGRGFGTGFSHTVEFSRNVAWMLFGDSPAVPASCHRRSGGTVPRAFQDRQRLPTCPESVLLGEYHPPRRHLHRSAVLRPHLLGVRTATEQPSDGILLAFGDLLSSDADAAGVVRRGPRS